MMIKPFSRLPNDVEGRFAFHFDWTSIFFAVLAISAGVGIAYAVQQFGGLALLLIPAVGLFIISIVFPELGLMTLIFVTVTQLSNVLIKFHGMPSIAQPLAAILLVVVLIRIFIFGERSEGWTKAAYRFALYGFIIFLCVLAAKSFQPANREFMDYIKDILVAMILVFLIQSPARFKHAIWAIIFAGIFIGSISALQHLTNTYSNNYWGFGGWVTEIAGQTTNNRVTGPFANPNAYSQVLAVIVILALDRFWNERSLVFRLLAGWALVACILSILFSYSRGGLLTLIFSLTLLLIERRPNVFPLVLTAALGIFLLRFLPPAYTERISTLTQFLPSQNSELSDQSFRGRLSENMASWMMFRDNPILGVGIKNFPDQYQKYSRQLGLDPRSQARSPASLYGEIIAEQGLLGSFAFCFLIWAVHRGLRQAKYYFIEAHLVDHARLASALWVGLAGYLFAAITKNSAYSNVFWLLIGLGMAAANIAVHYKQTQKLEETEAPKQGYMVV
jgi:putative inorganic carbon (hco3(-)) transporter